jgi:hypothetical protein
VQCEEQGLLSTTITVWSGIEDEVEAAAVSLAIKNIGRHR